MKKLIIDIDEKDYEVIKRECSTKDIVPIGWVQILNGKPLQTELEEIKAEISGITFMTTAHSINARGMIFTDSLNKLIDEHIAELKGENNETNN